MFDKMKGMMDQLAMMQKLMKDPNFRAFIGHPKVQEVFKDPEIQAAIQAKNMAKVMAHPKMTALSSDPELREIMSKLNPQSLL